MHDISESKCSQTCNKIFQNLNSLLAFWACFDMQNIQKLLAHARKPLYNTNEYKYCMRPVIGSMMGFLLYKYNKKAFCYGFRKRSTCILEMKLSEIPTGSKGGQKCWNMPFFSVFGLTFSDVLMFEIAIFVVFEHHLFDIFQ